MIRWGIGLDTCPSPPYNYLWNPANQPASSHLEQPSNLEANLPKLNGKLWHRKLPVLSSTRRVHQLFFRGGDGWMPKGNSHELTWTNIARIHWTPWGPHPLEEASCQPNPALEVGSLQVPVTRTQLKPQSNVNTLSKPSYISSSHWDSHFFTHKNTCNGKMMHLKLN